jgi:hypothetical protein
MQNDPQTAGEPIRRIIGELSSRMPAPEYSHRPHTAPAASFSASRVRATCAGLHFPCPRGVEMLPNLHSPKLMLAVSQFSRQRVSRSRCLVYYRHDECNVPERKC